MTLILHTALSLDGRTSGWPADRLAEETCLSRMEAAVHLIEPDHLAPASRTPLQGPPTSQPRLVVFDRTAKGRDYQSAIHSGKFSGICAIVGPHAADERLNELTQAGIDLIRTGDAIDWAALLSDLSERHGGPILAQSGGRLGGLLLEAEVVEQLSLLYNSVLVGPLAPYGLFGPGKWFDPLGPIVWELNQAEALEGGSLWARYQKHHR